MVCYTLGLNLAEWAESQGISRITVYRWYHQGKLPVSAEKIGGLLLVDAPGGGPSGPGGGVGTGVVG